eukprot:COSAG01_NODE_2294_length_7967_cov_41.570539_5_plen_82_part_00
MTRRTRGEADDAHARLCLGPRSACHPGLPEDSVVCGACGALRGCWQLGNRKVTLNVIANKLVVRLGGGFTDFLEFLEKARF